MQEIVYHQINFIERKMEAFFAKSEDFDHFRENIYISCSEFWQNSSNLYTSYLLYVLLQLRGPGILRSPSYFVQIIFSFHSIVYAERFFFFSRHMLILLSQRFNSLGLEKQTN